MAVKKDSTVFWWIGWITLTIASFFVCSWFWTGFIAKYVGPMSKAGVPVLWVTAVFGSWMVLLVPLIIVMYNKVDKAYEDARIDREAKQYGEQKKNMGVRCLDIDEKDRLLKKELRLKLKNFPETISRGHLVNVLLNDGRKIKSVFILDKKDVLGLYDTDKLSFKISDIADLEPVPGDHLPEFTEEKWLRLDGVGSAV